MSIAARISLGIAFLYKPRSSNTSTKCILHAEYLVQTRQYLLTKITYTHTLTYTSDAKITERQYNDVARTLSRLVRIVKHKLADGYTFDTDALEVLAEEDEQWDNYELLGKSSDPILDELSTANAVTSEHSGVVLKLRASRATDSIHRITRRDRTVSMAQKIRMQLAEKHSHLLFQTKLRVR